VIGFGRKTSITATLGAAILETWQALREGLPEVPLVVRTCGHETVFPVSVGRALRCDFRRLASRIEERRSHDWWATNDTGTGADPDRTAVS